MLRVDLNDLEPDEWGSRMLYDGILFTGIGYDTWPNGQPRSEIVYGEGLRDGVSREWYPSGQLKSEAEYSDGGAHGRHREWYQSGQLASDATYEHAILVSQRRYDESGKLAEQFQLTEDHPNFSTLQLKRRALGDADDSGDD